MSARVGGLKNSLTAGRERAVIQIAGAGVNRVVVIRINRESVNRDRREQRIVSKWSPRRARAATVGRFPNTAAIGTQVGNNGTVGCRGWINDDIVHPAFGFCVVIATRAA